MTRRPNILLIMTDQQRADSLGWCGGSDTPVLDALAARGVLFENAYSGATVCVPARASLLTGLLHHRLRLAKNELALEDGSFTVAHALARSGYETALFGKMHFDPMRAEHGFGVRWLCEHLTAGYAPGEIDDYGAWLASTGRADPRFVYDLARVFPYPAQDHPTDWITERAIEFLTSRDGSQPFFAVVSYAHPHEPYDPPEPYASRYDLDRQALPSDGIEVNAKLPTSFYRAILDAPIEAGYRPSQVGSKPPGYVRRVLAFIRALLKHIDDAVGRLIAHVDLSDTVVFFTSDHGDFGGHRGLLGKIPWLPFDDLAKVPFFCLGAGVEPGRRVRAPVQSFDFALTSLELAGVAPPRAEFDAKSLIPILRGGVERADRPVFCAWKYGWPMMRRGSIKTIWNPGANEHVVFDLESDPAETTNRASDPVLGPVALEHIALIQRELSKGIEAL
jgi:arylsulfatase